MAKKKNKKTSTKKTPKTKAPPEKKGKGKEKQPKEFVTTNSAIKEKLVKNNRFHVTAQVMVRGEDGKRRRQYTFLEPASEINAFLKKKK